MKREIQKVMFSSKSGYWETPDDLFSDLDREFHFTLDVCATKQSAKCYRFFPEDSGLLESWKDEVAFMNPPYGRAITEWISKAHRESKYKNATIVALLPARTDTFWFWEYILKPRREIRLIRGRLKFSNHKNSAPFPSMIVVFDPDDPHDLRSVRK